MLSYLNIGNCKIFLTLLLVALCMLPRNVLTQKDAENESQVTQANGVTEASASTAAPTTVKLTTEGPKENIINIAYFYQETDSMKQFNAAVNFVREKFANNFQIGKNVTILSDGTKTATQLCQALGDITPDIVIDFTRQGNASEFVKKMVRQLQLPTIAATFAQEGDVKEWRGLTKEEEGFLIHVSPPADVAVQAMRSIVDQMNMTSGVLLFDEQYEMYHKYKSLIQNLPCRHLLTKVVRDIPGLRSQIDRLVHVDIANFFIAAQVEEVTQYLIEASDPKAKDGPYFSDEFAWYSISLEEGYPTCSGCRMNASIVHLQPHFEYKSEQREKYINNNPRSVGKTKLTELFYFDLAVDAIITAGKMKMSGKWRDPVKVSCPRVEGSKGQGFELGLFEAFKNIAGETGNDTDNNILGGFKLNGNGKNYPVFKLKMERMLFTENSVKPHSQRLVGHWNAGFEEKVHLQINEEELKPHVALTVFRVVTVVQPPFVYRNESCMESKEDKYAANKCYYGYCIDLFNKIVDELHFNWTIRNVTDYGYMNDDDPHEWNGMIRELNDRKADIALGALSVMAERESVVDFTVPYYDLVGISILMKKNQAPTSLFKFLTVLEVEVWLCILGSYLFTSFIIWIYDRFSPMSYHNNGIAYPNEEDQRDFNVKECLWFCMTSLTPQGGGEAPKNLSGRIVSAIWWLFGFIIIASYTANLAAFLTVSRLDAPVESLEDLGRQYKVQYAPVRGSPAWIYFQRMSKIEQRFSDIWKDMALNDSLTQYEKSRISVWNYPVSMKYTKLFEAMRENTPPENYDEAITRVLGNATADEYALIGEATDVKYQKLTNCLFRQVGEEFSRKPYAIAVQKGSPLKESFSHMILRLLNQRSLENLKEKWWTENEKALICPRDDSQSDGISIQNIGGVFIVIFVGIVMACLTLIFEYWWYRKRDVTVDLAEMALPTQQKYVSSFVQKERPEFDAAYTGMQT